MRGRRASLGAFLLAVAAVASGSAAAATGGEQLYTTNCAVCHLGNGEGTPGLAPPLRTQLWNRMGTKGPKYLAGVMLTGMVGVTIDGQRYGAAMPPWNQLTDPELVAIGSYVLQKINGSKTGLDLATVRQARKSPVDYAALKTLRDGGT